MQRFVFAFVFALTMGAHAFLECTATPENGEPGLMIWAFCPASPDGSEYIVLKNPSPERVEGTWVLGDGEGTVRFSAMVDAGGRVLLYRDNASKWERFDASDIMLDIGSLGASKFRLSDSGDKIELLSGFGELIDAVTYGDGDGSSGWSGDPVPFVGAGFAPGRKGIIDTDTIDDWDFLRRVNASDVMGSIASYISVFAIPDAGSDTLTKIIEGAERSLDVNSYTISGGPAYRLFDAAMQRGVKVRVMVDDAPVGGRDNESLSFLSALVDSGVDVRLAGSFYRYDHAKYIVADAAKVMISTDNFGLTSYNPTKRCCNRGFGLMVEDPDIASNLSLIFESDWSSAIPYEPKVRGQLEEPVDGLYSPVFEKGRASSNASVAMYVTPEMGVSTLSSVLDSARYSIVAWLSDAETNALVKGRNWTNPLLDSLVGSSRRGIDVRVIVEERYMPQLQRWSLNTSSKMGIRALSNGLNVHAKVAIVDNETSLISSMNWVFNSIYKNREIGVLVKDGGISSYLADVFERDWSGDSGDPIARISMPGTAMVGRDVRISGIGSMDDTSVERFAWIVDGENVSNESEFMHVFESSGVHVVELTVIDSKGNRNSTSMKITVYEKEIYRFDEWHSGAWQLDILLITLGCGSLWSIRKRNKGKLKWGNKRSF